MIQNNFCLNVYFSKYPILRSLFPNVFSCKINQYDFNYSLYIILTFFVGKTREVNGRYRITYSAEQLDILKKEFSIRQYIPISRQKELSEMTKLTQRQIKYWFQNQRYKEKKKKRRELEIDGNALSPDAFISQIPQLTL